MAHSVLGKKLNRIINCILFTIIISFSLPTQSQEIIANALLPIDSITQSQLRSIYSMRVRTWPDDTPVTVFIFSPDSQLHKSFCFELLEVFPYQLQRIWDVLLFSGTGTIPIEVDSEATMLKNVANTPGAIGYIRSLKEGEHNVKLLQLK